MRNILSCFYTFTPWRNKDLPEGDGGGVAERREGQRQLNIAVNQERRWDCWLVAAWTRPPQLTLAPQPPRRPVAPEGQRPFFFLGNNAKLCTTEILSLLLPADLNL